jgi:hypothetical protein
VFDPDRDYKHYCEFDRSECDFATDKKSHINRHMDMHNNVRHACDKCEKDFSRQTTLASHIRTVHEGQKKKKNFPCKSGCGKMFESNYKQNEHFDFHHSNMAWACPKCAFKCERKWRCTAHIKGKHGGKGEPIKKNRT